MAKKTSIREETRRMARNRKLKWRKYQMNYNELRQKMRARRLRKRKPSEMAA